MNLFNVAPEELRELFVRNRFAEGQMYRNADIEKWLSEQTTAEKPDASPWLTNQRWLRFSGHNTIEVIRAGVETKEAKDLVFNPAVNFFDRPYFRWQDENKPFFLENIIQRLDPRSAEFYQGSRGPVVIYLPFQADQSALEYVFHTKHGTFPNEVMESLSLEHILKNDLIAMLLMTWRGSGPKKSVARKLLCDAMTECIKTDRLAVEKDFDRAVAATEDGTKIWPASKVVILGSKPEEDLVFSPEPFRKQKIILLPSTSPQNVGKNTANKITRTDQLLHASLGAYVDLTRSLRRFSNQSLVATEDGMIMFTTRDFCPQPLPEGGTLITP